MIFFRRIKELGLIDSVIYKDSISGQDKINLLIANDFFILPTNYVHEGQPVSIIEALAYKNIVITTNYRSIPDLLKNYEEGIFVDYNSPHQIYSMIKLLTNDSNLSSKIQESSYKKFLNNFTLDIHINNFINLFKNL